MKLISKAVSIYLLISSLFSLSTGLVFPVVRLPSGRWSSHGGNAETDRLRVIAPKPSFRRRVSRETKPTPGLSHKSFIQNLKPGMSFVRKTYYYGHRGF